MDLSKGFWDTLAVTIYSRFVWLSPKLAMSYDVAAVNQL